MRTARDRILARWQWGCGVVLVASLTACGTAPKQTEVSASPSYALPNEVHIPAAASVALASAQFEPPEVDEERRKRNGALVMAPLKPVLGAGVGAVGGVALAGLCGPLALFCIPLFVPPAAAVGAVGGTVIAVSDFSKFEGHGGYEPFDPKRANLASLRPLMQRIQQHARERGLSKLQSISDPAAIADLAQRYHGRADYVVEIMGPKLERRSVTDAPAHWWLRVSAWGRIVRVEDGAIVGSYAVSGLTDNFPTEGPVDGERLSTEIDAALESVASDFVDAWIVPASAGESQLAGLPPTLRPAELENHSVGESSANAGDESTLSEPPASETLALASPSEAASSESSALAAGLVVAGTSWTYELTDGIFGRDKSRIRVRVTSADDTFVHEEVSVIEGTGKPPALSRTIAARETSFDLYRLDADRALTEFAPYLLAAGGEGALKSASGAEGYPTSGYSGWVTRSVPPVWDQVTVPAGTFRALRFELRGRRQIPPYTSIAVQRFEIRIWYAPEVRRYVRLEHKTWLSGRRPDGDDIVELVEYRPPS